MNRATMKWKRASPSGYGWFADTPRGRWIIRQIGETRWSCYLNDTLRAEAAFPEFLEDFVRIEEAKP